MCIDGAGRPNCLHADHLGSPVAATDVNGDEVDTQSFYPFGELRDTPTSPFDTDRGFTGQIADAATGLNFYIPRYMDPTLGRFISPDSIVPDAGNPSDYNRFVYVVDNPLVFVDPTGHAWDPSGYSGRERGNVACQKRIGTTKSTGHHIRSTAVISSSLRQSLMCLRTRGNW